MLSAANAGSTINGVLLAPNVATPEVDGVEEESWTFPDVGMFSLIDSNTPTGAEDLSAWFKLGWNSDGLYLFVHVVDDTVAPSANSWESDCIEIFIDAGDEDSTSMSPTDVQWRAVSLLEGDTLVQCWSAGTNLRPAEYTLAWTENTDGYDMELAIPEAGLVKQVDGEDVPLGIDLVEGTQLGFDLQVTDNDSTTSDHGIRWHAIEGSAYSNPSLWGAVKLDDPNDTLQIPSVELNAEIDGVLDEEWTSDKVPEIGMTAIGGGIDTWPDSGNIDFLTTFRAAWNADGFYIFGKVIDDSIFAEEPTDANEWQLDGWEIYFDGDNSKNADYSDGNDVQWRFVYGVDTCTQGAAQGFEIAWETTSNGYNFELGIPIATLEDTNITLAADKVIGFEIQCADNDGSGREGITKWWNESNDSYLHPNLFGTAILQVNEDKVPEEPVACNIELSVPALITSNSVVVSGTVPAGVAAKVSLFNIAGQQVKAADGSTVTLDVSDLANGVYLCNLKAGKESVTKKVTLLK
jgi:hypothetical protein